MQEDKGSTSGRLGQFNAKEPVEELELDTIVVDVERIAPILWNFLTALVQQKLYYNSCNLTPHHSKIFMVCTILSNI